MPHHHINSADNQVPSQNDDVVRYKTSGVLYKWVNYVRGWRPRWFTLQDGVLSYFKIHHGHGNGPRSPNPLAQVHLTLCSVRESKSDERRFSVHTGIKKRLHLKAECKEERTTWVEAIIAAKEAFPCLSSSAAQSSVVVSTDRLRRRLREEGVSEAAIRESENIMRAEISHMLMTHNRLLPLPTPHTEKIDLENSVAERTEQNLKNDGNSYPPTHENNSDGSASDLDAFFDTCDMISTCSDRSDGSQQTFHSHVGSECEKTCSSKGKYDTNSATGSVKSSNYTHVKRRKKLPDPVEKETGINLWSIIKHSIGRDLTKVCLPVYFNEPLSSLQKCFEDLEYSDLLDEAYAWGKKGNSLMRMLHVAAFAVSGYASTDGRTCKPFNPLLGETYEADYPDKGIRFISEKVNHHPMILACHCEGRGWKFWGDTNLKSNFWGRSIHIDPVGVLTLKFDDGEVFQWNKVTTAIYNLLIGKLYCDHYGTMRIEGNREHSCKIKFKEQSIIDKNPRQVRGVVEDKKGGIVATIYGKWDESLHYSIVDENFRKGEGSNVPTKAFLLWKRSEPPEYQSKYNLTEFAITLNEITPGLREKLPPTDSRLRPDQRCLENGEYEMANAEKLRLEQRQRQARKVQENGWKPSWFAMDRDSHTYCYLGGYWEAREKGNWDSCHDIFGEIPIVTDIISPTP